MAKSRIQVPPNPELRTAELKENLFEAGMVNWPGQAQVRQDEFYGWTEMGEDGLGVGVHARGATDNVISLFNVNSQRPDDVYFWKCQHFHEYRPDIQPEVLRRWMDFIRRLSYRETRVRYYVVARSVIQRSLAEMLESMGPLCEGS